MNQLDPVNVAILWFAALLGSGQIAEIAGPYSVMFLIAALGASWSLGGTKGLTTMQVIGYFFLITCTAVFFTYYITQGIMFVYADDFGKETTPPTWLLAGVSATIGYMGTNLKKVPMYVFQKVKRFLAAWKGN